MPILNLQFSKRLKIRPQAQLTKEHCQQLQIDLNFKRYVSSLSSIFGLGQNGEKDMWNLHFFMLGFCNYWRQKWFFLQQQQLMSAAKQKRKDSPYDRLRKRTVDSLDEMFR